MAKVISNVQLNSSCLFYDSLTIVTEIVAALYFMLW